jgi:hypothetical protein
MEKRGFRGKDWRMEREGLKGFIDSLCHLELHCWKREAVTFRGFFPQTGICCGYSLYAIYLAGRKIIQYIAKRGAAKLR